MNNEIEQKINLETAQISWHELQRFFASGNAIAVDPTLDLFVEIDKLKKEKGAEMKLVFNGDLKKLKKDFSALE